MSSYILALDQGTAASVAMIFNREGQIVSRATKELTQHYPSSGWVEHDPNEIWSTQAGVAAEATTQAGLNGSNIAAIGITNQRETTIVWDRTTGKPIHNAIVWQDRRTAGICDDLRANGWSDTISEKTGLIINSYFSGTKIKWILDNVAGAREKAEKGRLAFGTVDSWLLWKFTRGARHVTDVTNAARTMLFNIRSLEWDHDLLELMGIPESMMPEVKPSSYVFGETATTIFATKVPIAGIAGDKHSALFGQMCIEPGMVKNTYSSGSFALMNTGSEPMVSCKNLLTTIAWKLGDAPPTYALEGSVFVTGAVLPWLREMFGIMQTPENIQKLASSVSDNGGVYMVPAFTGLGAPHWDEKARGTIVGLSAHTRAGHIVRAAMESICYQTMDVIEAMKAESGIEITELRVAGELTEDDMLMQFQSDILQLPTLRPKVIETTTLGAAYLAGLAVHYWRDTEELQQQWQIDKTYEPQMAPELVAEYAKGWRKALERAKGWVDQE